MDNKQFADFFRALANKDRVEILKLINKSNGLFNKDVVYRTKVKQPMVSTILKMFTEQLILRVSRTGGCKYKVYEVDRERILEILDRFKKEVVNG